MPRYRTPPRNPETAKPEKHGHASRPWIIRDPDHGIWMCPVGNIMSSAIKVRHFASEAGAWRAIAMEARKNRRTAEWVARRAANDAARATEGE